MTSTAFDRIRSRLAILLTLLLLPIVGYMAVLGWTSTRDQAAQARDTVRYLALIASSHQRELFFSTERLFRELALDPQVIAGGAPCEARLTRLTEIFPEYRHMVVADAAGAIICASAPRAFAADIAGKPYFELPKNRHAFSVASYVLNEKVEEPLVVASQPLYSSDDTFQGMLLGTMNFGPLPSILRNIEMPEDARFYFIDENGYVLGASHDWPARFRDRSSMLRITSGRLDEFYETGEDGVRRLFAASKIESGNLTAVFGVPAQGFLSASWRELTARILGPIAIWVIAVLIVWIATDRLITRPLRSLTRTARAYSYGDLQARPRSDGPSEIRTLAQTFTEMAMRIAIREQDLQDAVAKRDGMLREIHHRVKNNLQIVTSLLNLQEKSISEPAAKRAFSEIQTRVRALALVHRYLYESEDLQTVNLGAFLKELAASLQLAYGVPEKQVTVEVSAEPIWDISDRAIPLALLMTEAMTNALRHAFPAGRQGRIRVELRSVTPETVRFTVEDNGVGMPEGGAAGSLGMTLIRAFSRQVGGNLTIGGPPGTVITVEFTNELGRGRRTPTATTETRDATAATG